MKIWRKAKKAAEINFGSQAICQTDPSALRPYLTVSLPFRSIARKADSYYLI